MREITTKVYTFEELSDKAKERALDWYREGALDYEWWDGVYMDAENVGLKITAFDLGRGSYVEAKFLDSAEETAHKIEKEHGETCETYKTAKAYFKERDELIDTWPKDESGELENEYELDGKLDEIDEEFLKALQEDYRIMLEKEMEWLLSEEQCTDAIIANEYEFTEDGKRA